MVALGLRHHLVSKYTSLVAVDATPGATGFDDEDGALLPRTATTAPRWLLLATLLLGAAALVRARSNTGVLPTRGSGGGGRP